MAFRITVQLALNTKTSKPILSKPNVPAIVSSHG